MQLLKRNAFFISALARAERLDIGIDTPKGGPCASGVVRGAEVRVLLEGLIDPEKERARLTKEITRLTTQQTAVERKLADEKFASNAPESVVERERAKLESFSLAIRKLTESLSAVGG
jgi:valyl-tRNA synthetase